MNTLQFAKEVVLLLSDIDLTNIIKKASLNGFTVPGFKSPWKAPRAQIIGPSFEKKKRGGDFYYIIFLKTMENFDIIFDENIEISKLISKWLLHEDSHQEIEKQIEKYKQRIEKDKRDSSLEPEGNSHINDKKLEIEREIVQLQEKYKRIKEISQRLKEANKDNKIALDNLIKTNNKLQKENKQLKNINEILNEEKQKNESIIIEMKKQLDENKKWRYNTECQIKELEKYKQRAPKIFCLCKNKIEDIMLEGYDIIVEKIWNDEVKNQIQIGGFTEIWFISKGFSYNVIHEIRESYKGKVKVFLNVDKMVNEIGGLS